MHHRDLHRPAGKGVREDRNKRTALVAVEHRVDDMAAIGPQHAAVVTHRFTGGALDQAVDGLRRGFAEEGVLAVLTHGSDHVIALVRFLDQPRDLLRRVLQVGIKGNNQIAGDVAKARHDRRVLAVVAVQQHRHDVAAFGFGRRRQHEGGVIAAAVVDQQDFIFTPKGGAGGIRAANELWQTLLLVIHRDDHRDLLHGRISKHINVLTAGAERR